MTIDHPFGADASSETEFALPDTVEIPGVDDPYPYFAAARRRAPIQPGWPFPGDLGGTDEDRPSFSALGHDEVVAVLRDNESFSSAVLADIMGPMLGRTIIAMDEPEHRAYRTLVAPAFRPTLLARWEEELVRRVVDELIDEFIADGRADLVRQLTFSFPIRVIARILGLPEENIPQFHRLSIDLINMVMDWDRGLAASQALGECFGEVVAQRRAEPDDDLVSALIDATVDGMHLTDDDIFAFLRLLLPAGIETTYRSFGNLLCALLTHPEQLDAVTNDPALRVPAIEEALRWETPIIVFPRVCVRDTEVAGVPIPCGASVNVFIGSANRDERRYEHPDDFDIHRRAQPHASFGSGPHMCLGMNLARMESRIALDAVLERLPELRMDPDATPGCIVGSVFRSPNALPVRFSN